MRIFLVAGSPVAQPPAGLLPRSGDRVIAADYGAHHALAWGWPIHLLVGDLDSLSLIEIESLRTAGTPMIVAPVAKDETDLELALAHALAGEAHELVICGALGGRADHMLANVLMLARQDLVGVSTVIADGAQTLRLLRCAGISGGRVAGLTVDGSPGDLLTLLPQAGDAEGVKTAGLLYPLADETLFFAQARGVSNVFETEVARIWLRRGMLLVIHTHVEGV